MAEAVAFALVSSVLKNLSSKIVDSAIQSQTPSQTQQHHYRRSRGRIVPGSSNEEIATQPVDPSVVQVPVDPSPSGEGSGEHASMGKELLHACIAGRVTDLKNLVEAHGPDILLTVTPYGNSPLHLAVMLGCVEFAKEVYHQAPSLLSSTNIHGETPLIAALMAHNDSLASWLIDPVPQYHQSDSTAGDLEGGNPLKEMLLKLDRRQDNALHHALRNGFTELAVKILEMEPRLLEQANKNGESAMHMACRRGFSQVVEKILEFRPLSHAGPNGQSALDAATEAQRIDIIEHILRKCPEQAYHVNGYGNTPLCTAIEMRNSDIVEIFLKHDHNLAYVANENDGYTPFLLAANLGYVDIAHTIVRYCPDSAYALTKLDEMNALHEAIQREEHAFVHYILKNRRIHRLINQGDSSGDLPLHYAAHTCNPQLLGPLLVYSRQDHTAVNASNVNAADVVYSKTELFETPKWKESFKLVSRSIPSGVSQLVEDEVRVVKQEVDKIKSLIQMYTSNTAVVAALLATITFAAAFTLPGGYSNDPPGEGLPIFARKAAFQVFMLSDTIAMCSSLAVAFFCGLLTWKDFGSTNESKSFVLNYREWARALMWCAYASTSIAFATGLYTVLAPKCLWLAILIVTLCSMLPILSKIFSEWPRLKVWFASLANQNREWLGLILHGF